MTIRETKTFTIADRELKELLGLPKHANIKEVVVVDTAKYPDRVTNIRIEVFVCKVYRDVVKKGRGRS